MQAYEFYATPENGAIKIPEQYRNIITSGVKVILLQQNPFRYIGDQINGKRKSDLLLSPTMATKGWKFNREEANER
jgi:hypothetical protein